jgi:hypothetical protein
MSLHDSYMTALSLTLHTCLAAEDVSFPEEKASADLAHAAFDRLPYEIAIEAAGA